jgi:tetratricopeptide (TPR) repeat protein
VEVADLLETLLRSCTVRVMGGPAPGAGFFVAPGKVLTCVHEIGDSADLVVRWERDNQPTLEARVLGRIAVLADRGRPIPALDRDYPDIAVLQIGGLEGHPCVRIDPEWPSLEDRFLVFGYPDEGGAVQRTPARLTYRGTKGNLPTAYLDLASDIIKPGMSGAAVLNLRSGAVCGVVVASKHPAHPDGALAIPWSALDTDLADVLAANKAFHGQDRRWEQAAVARRERLRFRLPRVVAHFTGREDMLAELDMALSHERTGVITQTITGLGGVGKTQLVAAYAAAHQHEFDIAAWVRADDGGTADLAELAVALDLSVTGRTPLERASDTLVFLANTDRRWLLVFDNAPGPQALVGLPSSGDGRILVTSRHRGGYDTFGAELTVGVFDADTARHYLLARSGRSGEDGEADAVAAALGCLPLALAHAAAYCTSGSGVSFADYLELLDDLPSQQLFDTSPEVFYQHTVAATWNTSINAAEQQAPLARPALEMVAYLAPEAIPRSFFAVLEDNSAAGRKRMTYALTALHRFSLATVDDNQVSVHRLLQKVIRDRLADPDQADAITHALAAIQRALPRDPQLPATWPQWQELVVHIVALIGIEAVADLSPSQLVNIVNPTCDFLLRSGSNVSALSLATQAVSLSINRLGPEDPQTLVARVHLALSCRAAGRTGEAVTMHEQLVPDMERLLGPDHPDTLIARGNLAASYWSAGRADEAIAMSEQIITDSERSLGAEHSDTLIARGNLATLYWSVGRTGEAISIEERVVADRERLLGPDHPHTLTARDELAASYRAAGRTDEAIAMSEQVVADSQRLLGREHPATLTAEANLASSYQAAGRTGEAIAIFQQVTADRTRLLGPLHPDTLNTHAALGALYRVVGRTSEAIVILESVAVDRERLLGPRHPDTLIAEANLASSYRSAGRTGEAIAILEQVAADMVRLLGPDHPDTLTVQGELATSYRLSGRSTEAITIEERVVAARERLLGPDHPDTLIARGELAALYYMVGRTVEAIASLERVATEMERLLGSDHPDALTAKANLAALYQSAGRSDEAVATLEQVAADMVRLLGPSHPHTMTAQSQLAASYQAVGRLGEAVATMERVVANRERLLGPDHPGNLTARSELAVLYQAAERIPEAVAILEQVVADSQRLLGNDDPETLAAQSELAAAYLEEGRMAEVVAILEQIAARMERLFGPDHPGTLDAQANLATAVAASESQGNGGHFGGQIGASGC